MKIPPFDSILFFHWKKQSEKDYAVSFFILNVSANPNRQLPILRGKIFFTLRGERLYPVKVEVFKGNLSRFKTYKLFKEEFLSKVQYIFVPDDETIPIQKEFVEFMEKEGFPTPRRITICRLCFSNFQRVTLLSKKNFIDYYGKKVCKSCAMKEVREEFTKSGIEITESTTSFYKQQLHQTKSVEKTIGLLETRNKSKIKQGSTLFDVIPADTSYSPIPLKKGLMKFVKKGILTTETINLWEKSSYNLLLPVQQEALKNGLLDLEDLLVVAGTSSGKTFVGEIAGISNIIRHKTKFVFLTPLVSLTNQKYEQFKKRYRSIGFRVAIRVGMTKINVRDQEKVIIDGNVSQADIIVATYEAYDWILRSKQYKKMGDVGCLVVDEVQLLADEERGQELDGIIARTRKVFPRCQVIALSATIGNPEELASDLDLKLVHYDHRPIPLERHLVITEKEENKPAIISEIIRKGLEETSSTGYKGRSLIFTNSRRRAQELASHFRSYGLRVTHYHAGLTYYERKKVETMFEKQQLDAIVTTAALGAGVDFPVSQVILERPSMGAKWLTVAEFHQMYGRAGRYGYHDIGRVYLVVTPGAKLYSAMDRSEEVVAFDLLVKEIEPIDIDIDFYKELEQVLAGIATLRPVTFGLIGEYYRTLLFNTNQLNGIVSSLENLKLIVNSKPQIKLTSLGKAIAESFLDPKLGNQVAKRLLKEDVQLIAIDLAPFTAIHLSPRAQAELEQALKYRLPSRFLSDGVLEGITQGANLGGTFSKSLTQRMKKWQSEFLDCQCRENPYCDHPLQKITKVMIDLRKEGLGPVEINYELIKRYDLSAFPGDIFSWLEEFVHAIETISRIAKALNLNDKMQEIADLKEGIVQLGVYKKPIKKRKSTPIKKKRLGSGKSET